MRPSFICLEPFRELHGLPLNSSLELVQRTAPPPTLLPCVHSQWCSGLRHSATFDRSIPSNRYVPFSPFLTTSTVCSARSFAGLLHPAASHGVRPISYAIVLFNRSAETNPQNSKARSPAEAFLLSFEPCPLRFQSTIRR